MAKIARVTQKMFGSNAGFQEIAQFGSLQAGIPTFSTDVATIQSLSNYLAGWYNAVIGGNSPAIEDMNAVLYVMSYFQSYQFQSGVPEWDAGTTYYKGSCVQVPGYLFTVTAANATAGATYTNNGNTYIVQETITNGLYLKVTGPNSPLASGTLTKATGMGDSTITFSAAQSGTGIYSSISDTNLNNVVTDTSNWIATLPIVGLPFQHIATNSNSSKVEYTYGNYGTQTAPENVTVPLGINKMVGFYNIPLGITYTVNGSMTCIGPLAVNGTLVINGNVRIV